MALRYAKTAEVTIKNAINIARRFLHNTITGSYQLVINAFLIVHKYRMQAGKRAQSLKATGKHESLS